jgi:hypothetical protein
MQDSPHTLTTYGPREGQDNGSLVFSCFLGLAGGEKQMLAVGAFGGVTKTRERPGYAKHVKPGKQGVFDHNNL